MDNVFLFLLDSCRYDVFCAADAPCMKGVGPLCRAHSPSYWTYPSMMCYFGGYAPFIWGSGDRCLFSGVQPRLGEMALKRFRDAGYYMLFISPNYLMRRIDDMLNGSISMWFDEWMFTLYEHVLYENARKLLGDAGGRPVFLCMLTIYTHYPYQTGDGVDHFIVPEDPDLNFRNQVAAVEYTDKLFCRLLELFKGLSSPTEVIVTSEHGDLFGPEFYGHSPGFGGLRFDEKLFEIPFIRGWLNK